MTSPRPTIAQRASQVTTLTVGVGLGLVAWYGLAWFSDRLPAFHEVVAASVEILGDGSSYEDLIATFRRVVVAFGFAFVIGILVGALMGVSRFAEEFLRPWVMVAMALPIPVVIIVTLLIVGLGERSNLIALTFSVSPFVASFVFEGVKTLEGDLAEMSRAFGFGRAARWRHVIVPQMMGALFASVRTGVALAWKLVVVVEALAASTGVGAQMQRDFRLLHVDRMIAWAAIFTIVMRLLDTWVLRRAERRVTRWRPQTQQARGEQGSARIETAAREPLEVGA